MYYTVVNDKEFISASKDALKKLYTNVYVLPDDYEYRKYIISPETHQLVSNPNWEEEKEQAERERIGNLQVTKRVFALALQQLGITYTQLKELIATNEQAQLEWDLCIELQRKNPLLDIMGLQLGITPEQIDYIFRTANGEEVEPIPVTEEND